MQMGRGGSNEVLWVMGRWVGGEIEDVFGGHVFLVDVDEAWVGG